MTSPNGNIFRVTGHLWGNSPVTGKSPHKGQWREALIFSLIFAWINGWSKPSRRRWFETPSCPLWLHCNVILCMRLANEKRRYNVTSSHIGWAHIQIDPCRKYSYFLLSMCSTSPMININSTRKCWLKNSQFFVPTLMPCPALPFSKSQFSFQRYDIIMESAFPMFAVKEVESPRYCA